MSNALEVGDAGEGAVLLPWESPEQYRALRDEFRDDHQPHGATENALVTRLIWIEWRRRRLALAERAAHMAGLADRIDEGARTLKRAGVRDEAVRARLDLGEIVGSDAAGDAIEAKRHGEDRKASARALAMLERGGAGAYKRALAALHEDTSAWWEESLAGEHGEERVWTPTEERLAAFLRKEVGPVDEEVAAGDAAGPAIRLQAFGESLDPHRIERLLAIEARLDRQFEKALAMLIQVRAMRVAARLPRQRGRQAIARG